MGWSPRNVLLLLGGIAFLLAVLARDWTAVSLLALFGVLILAGS